MLTKTAYTEIITQVSSANNPLVLFILEISYEHIIGKSIKTKENSTSKVGRNMRKNKLLFIYTFLFIFLFGCQDYQKPEDEVHKENVVVEKSTNFLVLGVDSRGETKSRADSILVVQYSPEDRVLKVISIMRDSFVKIPGYKHGFGKINAAYYTGGNELLKQTINHNFGIEIDHTVTIDFQGFVNVIDTLVPEGITVHVSQKMINDMSLKNMTAGENTLHGKDLLKYVRFRHDARSDFGRVERQQDVLMKVMNKMHEKINTFTGIAKVPLLVDEALKNVESDLNIQQILAISSSVASQPIEKIDTLRIPIEDGYTDKNVTHSGAVLELNIPKNKEAMHKFFSEPEPVSD